MSLLGFCEWLEHTGVSSAIRESAWAFSAIESVHVLGLCLVGLALLVDLRVLDLALNRLPVSDVTADVTPWARAGIVVVLVSGLLVFLNSPVEYYKDTFFRIKMILMLLVAANAWSLRGGMERSRRIPRVASVLLWSGIVVTGRMIGYHLLPKL